MAMTKWASLRNSRRRNDLEDKPKKKSVEIRKVRVAARTRKRRSVWKIGRRRIREGEVKRKETSFDEGRPGESRAFPWMISLSLSISLSLKSHRGVWQKQLLVEERERKVLHLDGPLVGLVLL